MSTKPKLFLDVDGVFLAPYGKPKVWQLRPGAGSFLTWTSKHFDCYWLTCHGPDSTKEIARLSGGVKQVEELSGQNYEIQYVEWRVFNQDLDKLYGVLKTLDKLKNPEELKNMDWLVLEDGYPCHEGYHKMFELNLQDKWIVCPHEDCPEMFKDAQKMLKFYLDNRIISPPWPQMGEKLEIPKEEIQRAQKVKEGYKNEG